MTSWPQARARSGGVLAAALARAEAWLLEPGPPGVHAAPVAPPAHPVVAVRGLAPGSGASTIARALAAALARMDPAGAAVVVGGPAPAAPRLATPAAGRIARRLAEGGCHAVRASGRVCVVGRGEPAAAVLGDLPSAVVFDVAHHAPPAEGLGQADVLVLVASPEVEVALVSAVELSLGAAGHRVEVAMNRVDSLDPRSGPILPGALAIGDSRLAAQLALGCREPRGPLAAPIAELAERCRAAVRG